MNIRARPYRDDGDLASMRHLLMVGMQNNPHASYMHPGCLDWATHYPQDAQANKRNLLLWECIGTTSTCLKAWAIYSHREGSFDLFVHPAIHDAPIHETIMDEYMVWAEARAREAGLNSIWPFWAMSYDKVLDRLMKTRGFEEIATDTAPPLFACKLDKLPAVQLPEGFSLREVRTKNDGKLRAEITHSAFQHAENWDDYLADYYRFMESSVYDRQRDLFLRSADGRGAAACTIWFDPINAIGLFEPVGTHIDFRGRGLAKAVMAEGMRRMKAAGMSRAIVGFDPDNLAARALYTSLGFRASCYFSTAQKKIIK